jgi:hypothetical protein
MHNEQMCSMDKIYLNFVTTSLCHRYHKVINPSVAQQSAGRIYKINCVKVVCAAARRARSLPEDALTSIGTTRNAPARFCTDLTQGCATAGRSVPTNGACTVFPKAVHTPLFAMREPMSMARNEQVPCA